MGLIHFLRDILRFPFDANNPNNKFKKLLEFLIKQYPVYMREKKTFWRFLLLPFLVIAIILEK